MSKRVSAPSSPPTVTHIVTVGDPMSPSARELDQFRDPRTAREYVRTVDRLEWQDNRDDGAVGIDHRTGKPVHIVSREGYR